MMDNATPESASAKLRIYIGAAPGVGKTYRILQYAHELQQRGEDIVIGLADVRGRAEAAALLDGLEIIPPRVTTYRSIALSEMDLDAILARHPRPASWTIFTTPMSPDHVTAGAMKTSWTSSTLALASSPR